MRLRVFSDLHLEAGPFEPPVADADVVILAGDIHNGAAGIEWGRRRFDGTVIYVAGNHESYEAEFHATRAALQNAAAANDIILLDCAECVLDGVRFLGCTLWTDFALLGEAGRDHALSNYGPWLADFRLIRWHDRAFTADDSIAMHARERAWLAARLTAPFAGDTVVVTHHAPHPGSIAPKYTGHPLNPAFISNLEGLMGRARLWIHGHTHYAFDYAVRGTRIISNARGYPGENTGFKADLVIAV